MNEIGVLMAAGLLEAACSSSPAPRAADAPPAMTPVAAPAPAAGASAPVALPQPSLPPPPPRATADFGRAVALVRAGKDEEAELQFQQLATGYPQYPGALVNLGLLYRKHGDLAKSETALQAAVQRDPHDAEAFTELGVTLRLDGKFHQAADAYNQAIASRPDFAPAYRNLAIVLDLYLGDTAGALTAMEHYQSLAPNDKAVVGWIADLKQRAGKNAAPPAPQKAGGST
ncbi:MAG TPA: tetratricopeptide repeat protein [Steroidobacteraceae bacterium]|nr:tetratricopeptide repeat protein [Steroidobacteraceae bacterium]